LINDQCRDIGQILHLQNYQVNSWKLYIGLYKYSNISYLSDKAVLLGYVG